MSTAPADPFVEGIDALLATSAPGCALGKWAATLTPARREALDRALATDPKVLSGRALLAYLHSQEFKGGKSVLNEHRAGTCTCVR